MATIRGSVSFDIRVSSVDIRVWTFEENYLSLLRLFNQAAFPKLPCSWMRVQCNLILKGCISLSVKVLSVETEARGEYCQDALLNFQLSFH
jgi:hypothetical protein